MTPQLAIAIFVVGVIALAIGIWLAVTANKDRKTFEDAQRELDEEREALAKKRTSTPAKQAKPSKTKKTDAAPVVSGPSAEDVADQIEKAKADLRRQLGDVKEKLEKQRRRASGLSDERDQLKEEVQNLKTQKPQTQVDQGVLVDLRMDLADALAQVEHYKSQLGKKAKAPVKSAPKKEETPQESKPSPSDTTSVGAEVSEDQKAQLRELGQQLKAKEQEIRDLKKAQKQERRKILRDVDRQRRRADNNDKAFRVTQRELDAARSRVSMLTKKTATPVDTIVTTAPVEKSATPLVQAVEVTTKEEDRAPVSVTTDAESPTTTLEVELGASQRNEDDHETVEFDPKLVEAVVREAEASESEEATEDVVSQAASSDDGPSQEPSAPEPIKIDADTTFDDIPLADEAMSIDDAWSEFMTDDD